jgi:2-methylisocitrate lyase-like PEP mutase family enzyme
MNHFRTFSALHQGESPFLLGNIWDVRSALSFQNKGFKAIGTSSQAVASSWGYEDGENIPFEILLRTAQRVVEVVNIPCTVDIEGGFARSAEGIIENIKRLHDVGVAGINLEDSFPGQSRLQSLSGFQATLSKVVKGIQAGRLEIFLNVRTDGFLLGIDDALNETLSRIKVYEECGANGIFVPGITDNSQIGEVVNATDLPVNVMCMPELPTFDELALLGVKRISMGPFLHNLVNKKTEEMMQQVMVEKNFSSLFK